jgi:hypothetical protein
MSIPKIPIGWAIATFVWSLFMGVTAISIGVGAAFPPMNLVAKPFVCPFGDMTVDQETSNPLPGTTYTQVTWYCTDAKTGQQTELDIFPMSLYSGAIYGFLLFAIIAVLWAWNQWRNPQAAPASSAYRRPYTPPPPRRVYAPSEPATAEPDDGTLARLKELKRLRASNMITEAEYEEKRSEIIKKI